MHAAFYIPKYVKKLLKKNNCENLTLKLQREVEDKQSKPGLKTVVYQEGIFSSIRTKRHHLNGGVHIFSYSFIFLLSARILHQMRATKE